MAPVAVLSPSVALGLVPLALAVVGVELEVGLAASGWVWDVGSMSAIIIYIRKSDITSSYRCFANDHMYLKHAT